MAHFSLHAYLNEHKHNLNNELKIFSQFFNKKNLRKTHNKNLKNII